MSNEAALFDKTKLPQKLVCITNKSDRVFSKDKAALEDEAASQDEEASETESDLQDRDASQDDSA